MASGSFRGDAGLRVEVQRKAQCVDPGIGAAAPLDIGAAVEHRFQPILKGLGHAPPVGLHLKAAVVGAIVRQNKQVVHHIRNSGTPVSSSGSP